jgi:DNA invertase Pin-like site-specific DNA recombinase
MDTSTPDGHAMLQMAAVFAQLERSMIQERVMAGLTRARSQGKTLGRPKVAGKVERAIRARLETGEGMLKVAKALGVGTGTVQRVKAEIAAAAD